MTHKWVHIPEDDEPDTKKEPPHTCKPVGKVDRNHSGIDVKHRSIAECQECGQYWWATVYKRYNSFGERDLYHLEWGKLRWYHFRLKKFVR